MPRKPRSRRRRFVLLAVLVVAAAAIARTALAESAGSYDPA